MLRMKNFNRWTLMLLCLAMVSLIAFPAFAEQSVIVQVMSMQDEAAAQKEASKFNDQGIPAFSRAEEVPDKGTWNRVYIGPFDNEADAKAAASHLQSTGAITSFIVKKDESPEPASATQPESPPAGDEPMIVIPPAPENLQPAEAPLPVAPIPTYGEPISPEMAEQMGLNSGTKPPTPALTDGADLPGMAPGGNPPALTDGADLPGMTPGGNPPALTDGADLPGMAPGGNPPALTDGADLPGMTPGGNQPGSGALIPPALPEDTPAAKNVVTPVAGAAGNNEAAPTTVGPPPASRGTKVIPAIPTGEMKIDGFNILVDLSSSMRRMSNCQARIKEEAVASLLRKINQRIPSHPYQAVLRVFGYKKAVTNKDFTTTYFGPASYDRNGFEDALARLVAADSVSPFGAALAAANDELAIMGNAKAVLMFSDFEESIGAGAPVASAQSMRRRYGKETKVYTFYTSRQSKASSLAKEIATAGGGKSYDICVMLSDPAAFEEMMMEIFGPSDIPPCADQDEDGVCDDRDQCPNTPIGAPVDERGCWIAAYAQFFDFDKAVVKSEFTPRLKNAAEIMNKNPQLPKITIAGHTDGQGTEKYNMDLGQRRAQAVKDLLVEYGVAADRLAVESFGKSRPIAANDTEEGRSKNRRVEFHIGDVPLSK